VDMKKGWENVSLPFIVDMVTTQNKGEITHFYEGSTKGHEYWLRQYKGGAVSTTDSKIFEANFNMLNEQTGNTKNDGNSFLWDYYYKAEAKHNQQDARYDTYLKYRTYYRDPRTYDNYPQEQAGVPYLIGFPGATYYEFDLSGKWRAETTASPTPTLLLPQIITFVSPTETTIGVSDSERDARIAEAQTAGYDFAFVPNYATKSFDAGAAYLLNGEGSSFDVTTVSTTTVPFRPYFIETPSTTPPNEGGAREKTRSIVFSSDDSQLKGVDDRDLRDEEYGSLDIYAKRKKIIVESNLHEITEVRIVNTAGITVTTFDIEPGETIETRITNSGVYIVQSTDGRYNKKLVVK